MPYRRVDIWHCGLPLALLGHAFITTSHRDYAYRQNSRRVYRQDTEEQFHLVATFENPSDAEIVVVEHNRALKQLQTINQDLNALLERWEDPQT